MSEFGGIRRKGNKDNGKRITSVSRHPYVPMSVVSKNSSIEIL